MSTYQWRNNFTAFYSDQEKVVRGKLAFKTKETHWLETEKPVIILISIHSAFHEMVGGDLKMNALISTIRSRVKGKVTILLSDKAHLQTLSLYFQNDLEKAFQECMRTTQSLCCRYHNYFKDCRVEKWHSYISEDGCFVESLAFLKERYRNDEFFRRTILQDVDASYTGDRVFHFPDKQVYVEKAIEDLLQQCASLFVLAKKGYRYQFYTGKPNLSVEYVNRTYIPESQQVSWIDVFLTIEKKTITPL